MTEMLTKLFGNYDDLITRSEYYHNSINQVQQDGFDFDFELLLSGKVLLVFNSKTFKSFLIQFTGDIEEGNLLYCRYIGPSWRIRDRIRVFTKLELKNFFHIIKSFEYDQFDYKVIDDVYRAKLLRIRKAHIRKRYWKKAKENRDLFQKFLRAPDPDPRDNSDKDDK